MHGAYKPEEVFSGNAPAANPLQRRYLQHANGLLTLPDLDYLNAEAARRGIRTGGGLPLRFALPDEASDYEYRAYHTGIVATRPGNWHDVFNALVWLNFPSSKAALNTSHLAAKSAHSGGKSQRGSARDVLTQFDECGVIVVGTLPALWQMLCQHQWSKVFVEQRPNLLASTRFIVFGHGSLDALRAPFVGLCGKAIFIQAEVSWLAAIDAGDFVWIDTALARRVTSTNWQTQAGLQPIPLLGIPGATAENERPEYYQDRRQFRPRR